MNPIKWRKLTWVIWIFTTLMIAWMLIDARDTSGRCSVYEMGTADYADCLLAANRDMGLDVRLLIIWFVGLLVLSSIWLMTRGSKRTCPACGHDLTKGQTVCKKCGYDYAAHAAKLGT